MPIIIFLFICFIPLLAIDNINELLSNANTLLQNNKTEKAVMIYNELDKNNVVEASYNLGMIYGYGINGIEEKQKLAIKYLTKATLKSHKKAPYYLSLLLSNQEDVNQTKIKILILKSAVSGFDKAQLGFGRLLLEQNKTKFAKEWMDKARKQGNMEAEALWYEL